MSKIINFENYKSKGSSKLIITLKDSYENKELPNNPPIHATEDKLQQTVDMLVKMHPGKVLYSLKETARILNVSYQFVNQLCKQGILNAINLGDRILININDLSKIINEGTTNEYKKIA